MLTKLGARHVEQSSMPNRLLDCHARIRGFCNLAIRLADGGPADQVREAATQLWRYFAIALPLHLRDEEASLRPRLERLDDAPLLAALATMTPDHRESDRALGTLVAQWQAIAGEPTERRCQETRTAAAWLDAHMHEHLRNEEEHIFPALQRLPQSEWTAIVDEMVARRR
ncbi:MAG TPA: hemerythrin domain-containing protein [Polyangia bacterium]|nr:hemerythrin domain-containing protein [Polyangia bacterium]